MNLIREEEKKIKHHGYIKQYSFGIHVHVSSSTSILNFWMKNGSSSEKKWEY